MESLIFAFAVGSLLLLVPILFFLPLGLTKKGKVTLLVVSFLIAIVGILAQATFVVWQAGLLVVLLACLATYLLEQRMGNVLFVSSGSKKMETFTGSDVTETNDMEV